MALTFEQQLELKDRLEKVLEKEIGFIIPSPYAEIVHSLVSKLEEVGGQTNVNEPTDANITTSDAVAPAETATSATAGSEPAVATESTATIAK